MNFSNTKVFNFEGALRGMRNPMNSWDKSDSEFGIFNMEGCKGDCKVVDAFIGPKDMNLAKNLISAGSEHCKFLRQIMVSVDIVAPRYIWSEFDTYHFNTKNSCSTMHKLLTKDVPVSLSDFKYSESEADFIALVVDKLNELREEYLKSRDNSILERAKQILPEGFLQLRTVTTSYAEIRSIYKQRKSHRLSDWNTDFVDWVENLPYAKDLLI